MKRQMNQTILENGVYGLLWAVVLVVPLFGYHDGSGIRWCGVFHFWLGVLPFALLFALHNYLLVPLLLMRRRYGVYVLCVVALIGLIFTAVPMLVIRPEPPATGRTKDDLSTLIGSQSPSFLSHEIIERVSRKYNVE